MAVEPVGYLATIPGPDGSRICVGPFETRQAALDFCSSFVEVVEVDNQVMVGPMYPPASMLALAMEAFDQWRTGNDDN